MCLKNEKTTLNNKKIRNCCNEMYDIKLWYCFLNIYFRTKCTKIYVKICIFCTKSAKMYIEVYAYVQKNRRRIKKVEE